MIHEDDPSRTDETGAADPDRALTTIVLADDHVVVRHGLRLVLEGEEDITVEDEGGTADDAVRLARLHKPDVVLLDVTMPGRSGLDAADEIRQAAPKAAILVLSMHDDPSYVREAFGAAATSSASAASLSR